MKKTKNSYKKSGVNIKTADKFTGYIAKYSKKAFKNKASYLANNIGGFGSVYNFNKLNIKDPLLVSSTDGVGTKLEIANKLNKFNTIGIDLVAMCVNDLIVQGAKPLFFLDYIALKKIKLKKMKEIIKSIIQGCKLSDCILVGGETAEMPGIYEKNKFDLAGFAVGVVSKKKLLHKGKVKDKDIILAVPSNGLHSNGFSLVRYILRNKKINNYLGKELLKPTKIYVESILKLSEKKLINASANITGGGIVSNIIRSVPNKLSVNIDLSKIRVTKIFKWLKSNNISDSEMLKTFNCGVGFCLITKKSKINKIKKIFDKKYKPYEIGFISKSSKKIKLFNKIKW
tara:strand:- start:1142 stop:2167 length:1026 start_codon:yes stop_codon:yes gene_type:complete